MSCPSGGWSKAKVEDDYQPRLAKGKEIPDAPFKHAGDSGWSLVIPTADF